MPSTAPIGNPTPLILIVEDDGQVGELVSDILVAEGFEPVCVATDRQAFDALRMHRFDAVLIDINLGVGATGYDVARFARKVDPRLPVIYVSGQTTPASVAAFGVPHSLFVAKPFTAAELMHRVNTLLGANEP